MEAVALVLAAGQGTRLGADRPKGLVQLVGRSVLEWSALALARARGVAAVLPVVPQGPPAVDPPRPSAADPLQELRSRWPGPARLLEPVLGGATRQASVERGLAAARAACPELAWVLIHDAARCLVEPGDAEAVLSAAAPTGAALPVLPASDTVKRVAEQRVVETLKRESLGLAQTPQAFRVALLQEALEKARRDGFQATDCSSLLERLGVEVRVCPGRPGNWKLTHPEDVARAAAVLRARDRT